jgi:hypothetical protein
MKLNDELNLEIEQKNIKIDELNILLKSEIWKQETLKEKQNYLQREISDLRTSLKNEQIKAIVLDGKIMEGEKKQLELGFKFRQKASESDSRQTQIVVLLSTIDYLKTKNGVVPIEEHQDAVIEYQKAIESKDFIIRSLENQIQRMEESSKKISIRRIQSTHHSMTPYASNTMNPQSDTMVKKQNTATNQGRIISSKPLLLPLRGQSQKQTRNKEEAKKTSNVANTILPINPASINRTNLKRLQLSEKFQKRRLDSKKRGRLGSHGYDSSIP